MNRFASAKLSFLLILVSVSVRAEDDAKKPTYPVEVSSIQTILVDANGQPIKDVKATVRGVRCLEDPGSWYSWPSANIGKLDQSQSQSDGNVAFQYPVKFGVPEKWLTTTTLDISFSHPDFVALNTEIKLSKVPQKIKLESGCKVELNAIDESGKPLGRFFPLVSGNNGPPNWTFTPGSAKAGCVPTGRQLCMLASPSESGALFSDLFEFETEVDKAFTLSDIVVRPGKRVFGRLPDSVPRPIVDGSVSLEVLMTPDQAVAVREPLEWSDAVAISEDGTFEFKSVPGPARIQVIAICRGWVIRSEKPGRVNGQTFNLQKDQSELEVSFEMEQTGDIRVELMNVDGESVVGAKVYTWPNKLSMTGGSSLLATSWRSIDFVERLLKGESNWSPWGEQMETNRHYQISDEEGMVTLRDIPVGGQESIDIEHPNYDLPYEVGEVRNDVKYRVVAGETEERLLVLQKRATPKPSPEK